MKNEKEKNDIFLILCIKHKAGFGRGERRLEREGRGEVECHR